MYQSNSELIEKISRILFPFILLFGIYIILYGDQSPGGGFQGGAIIGTSFFISYIIKQYHYISIKNVIIFEKTAFLILILISLLKVIPIDLKSFYDMTSISAYEINRFFLVLLNIIIGAKVASGFMTIFSLFLEEGE